MIEYLYDAIRATAGSDIQIAAKVLDDLGQPIADECDLIIHLDDDYMLTIGGDYVEDTWVFAIPADFTKDLKGKYWYCIKHNSEQLCFKQPIYFV